MRVGRPAGGSSWPPRRTTQERLVPRAGWWSATSATTSASPGPSPTRCRRPSPTPTPPRPRPWSPSTPRRVGRAFGWLERVRQARRVDRGAAHRPGFDPGEASRAVQRVAEQRTRGAKTEAVAAPDATLRELWQAEARAGGWDPGAIARRVLAGAGLGLPE